MNSDLRGEDSTTYAGAIETAELFGRRLYAEAHHRGWSRAQRKVVIGDGAVWIWNIADELFPGATQIVDLYHARQNLWELSGKVFASDPNERQRWVKQLQKKLDAGKIEPMVKSLRAFPALNDELAHLLATESRVLRPQRRTHALQNCHRIATETIWDVLDCTRRQRHHRLRCNRLSHKFEDY